MSDILLTMLNIVGVSIIGVLLLVIWGAFILVALSTIAGFRKDRQERKEIDSLLTHIANVRKAVQREDPDAYIYDTGKEFFDDLDGNGKTN